MDKNSEALDLVYETLVSKRARSLPFAELEPLFSKFITLAVSLRRGKYVKDGLHQYKKLALGVSSVDGVSSLIRNVDLLLALSEDAVAKAQQQAEEVQVEDLEQETPHDLLLAMVNSEEARDRTDREVVTPWLKLLWENYRSVLDVLRNHSQLEVAYANVASQAFRFCLKFNRKVEFRRLAELIRTHLQYAATQSKHYHATLAAAKAEAIQISGTKDVSWEQIEGHIPANAPSFPVDLSDPRTLQRFLDTRFEQLSVAVELELWQEAFRSVEDVHSLFSVTHRGCPISSIAAYYKTLAQVFAVSNNFLFHAAVWFRYFSLLSSHKTPPQADLRNVASLCILSVLCIPSVNANQPVTAKERRWMALINLQRCPTRQSLLEAVMEKNVLEHAAPELRSLFTLLVQNFQPLTLKRDLESLTPALVAIPEFKNYSVQLAEVLAASVFEDLALSYSELRLDFVLNLASLPSPFNLSNFCLERLLVKGSVNRYRVRINHANRTVRFVDSLATPLPKSAGSAVRSQLFDLENCFLQLPSNAMSQKDIWANRQPRINAPPFISSNVADFGDDVFDVENQMFNERRQQELELVTKLKATKQAEEEAKKRHERQEAERQKAEEAERQEAEQRRLEAEQQQRDIAMSRRQDKLELAKKINAMGFVQVDLSTIDDMDIDQLEKMQIDQFNKEARDLSARGEAVARRYDHLERALRAEEAKHWIKDAETQASRDKLNYERHAAALKARTKATHDLLQSSIARMARVKPFYEDYLTGLKTEHDAAVAEKKKQNAALLESAKQKRIAEVEERRIKDEELRKQREIEEAEAAKLEEERKAKEAIRAAEVAERRRKAQEAREEFLRTRSAASPSPSLAPATGSPALAAAQAAPAAAAATSGAASPFGKARPVSAAAAKPAGAYRPPVSRGPAAGASTGASTGAASPFGSARPVPTQSAAPASSSPFGNAKPGAPASSSPFGNAKPGAPASSSPFGNAKAGAPATGASRASPKPSIPTATPVAKPAPRADPFGKAKPVAQPATPAAAPAAAEAPAADRPKKFVPAHRRAQK